MAAPVWKHDLVPSYFVILSFACEFRWYLPPFIAKLGFFPKAHATGRTMACESIQCHSFVTRPAEMITPIDG
jgi:hypothetical protein